MSIIHKIRGGGKQSAFIEAPLFEITEELHNPARGWYQVYNFDLGKDVDFDELYWCLGKHDRLALLMVDIGRYKDADLDETADAAEEEAAGAAGAAGGKKKKKKRFTDRIKDVLQD